MTIYICYVAMLVCNILLIVFLRKSDKAAKETSKLLEMANQDRLKLFNQVCDLKKALSERTR